MVNLILYGVLLAVLLYTAILYGSQAMVLLVFAGALLVLIAYGYLIYQYFQIKATILVPIATAEPGQSVDVELHTKNKGHLPVLKIRYCIGWQNFLQGKEEKCHLTGSVDAQSKSVLRTSCQVEAAGNYNITLKKIKIYDLLGIFYISRRIGQEANIQGLPKLVPMNVKVGLASRHFVGESDVYDDAVGGSDPSEVFQIREFRPGDKIQSIHWKLSAKEDELMVRENSQPLGCPVVLLADKTGLKQQSILGTEHFLQVLYSLSFHLVEQKCPHYIVWECGKGESFTRVRVENEEGIYLFLMKFFAENRAERKQNRGKIAFSSKKKTKETGEEAESLRERYKKKYRAQNYITDVTVDGALSVLVNGAPAGKLQGETFEADCERLELIV